MKQVLENFKTGQCDVEDVPAPLVRENFVLVKNHFSLISTGTEGGTVQLGKMSLLGKARARPEQAMKVLQVAKSQGLLVAYNAAMRSLEMPIVLGYCCAGEVIDVGDGVDHVKVGDRVACGGAGFANHAEIVCIPKNLCVKVPENTGMHLAAFTTLGSIALQSVRVADVRLGDNVVVIGLGLVGLLTIQILKAAGCNVFGIDIDKDRVDFVKRNNLGDAETGNASNLKERINAFTSGNLADAVIITAATDDNEPVKLAGELCRRKGRVIAVGRTRLEAPRETYLFKELELCTSMAYGPGTGDPEYELNGIDYPVGYVRWTEGRNMQCFADLIAANKINLEQLITHNFDIQEASKAFELISGKSKEKSIAVLIKYPVTEKSSTVGEKITFTSADHKIEPVKGQVQVGVIGAGSFATNEFLPLLAKQKDLVFRGIVSATGVRAKALGKKYGFQYCDSNADSVIKDDQINCVFILTRHDSHADLAVAALNAGKHVFVEKPLATTHAALQAVQQAQNKHGCLLMVGFNRRYAPLAVEMKNSFGETAQPVSIHYCVNVGYRSPEHWLHDPKQGGGVILGEACHQIDFCNWFISKPVKDIDIQMLKGNAGGFLSEDNVHMSLRYDDGSIAHITYLSNGSKSYATERIEIFCDNKVAVLTDFNKLEIAHGMSKKTKRYRGAGAKGHHQQINALISAIKNKDINIDMDGYINSSKITIDAAARLKKQI